MEEALLHHLQALRELPGDIIISPRIVLSDASFRRVSELSARLRRSTKALHQPMSGKRRKKAR